MRTTAGPLRKASVFLRPGTPAKQPCPRLSIFSETAVVPALATLLRRGAVAVGFDLGPDLDTVLKLMLKYADLPASLADVCLVRMTETFPDPVVVTTDADFRVYRRQGRRMIPCVTPS